MYDWRCTICDESNAADLNRCTVCGYPSIPGPFDDPKIAQQALKSGESYQVLVDARRKEWNENQIELANFIALYKSSRRQAWYLLAVVEFALVVISYIYCFLSGTIVPGAWALFFLLLAGVYVTNGVRLARGEPHMYIPASLNVKHMLRSAHGERSRILWLRIDCIFYGLLFGSVFAVLLVSEIRFG